MRNVLLAASVALAMCPAMAAEQLIYESVWSLGSGSNLVTGPRSRSEFLATGEDLTQRGLRLIDVETAVLNGNRVYTGLWASGTGTNLFVGPIGPIDMRDELIARRQQNLRLNDFEVIRTAGGGRRYVGVWGPGTGREILTGPMKEEAFLARGQRLVEHEDMRLIDVEIERVSGVVLYHGLFRSSVGANFITTPVPRGNFLEIRDEMVVNGLELVDFETLEFGGETRYAGVWSSGDGVSSLSVPRDFAAYLVFGEERAEEGFRTHDLELAVVGEPDPDSPPTDPDSPPTDPDADDDHPSTSDLPLAHPPGITLVDGNILIVNFTPVDDNLSVEIPADHLPDWLPSHEGVPVLPQTFCGFNILRADRILWSVSGEVLIDNPTFNSVENVAELGNNSYLGGVEFTGPIGACAGTQTPWQFGPPFTQGDAPFEPLPNMRLVIQLEPEGEIRFRRHQMPEFEFLQAGELFSDEVFETMEDILEAFAEFGEDNGYCEGVQGYMVEVCDETPSLCPVNPEEGPPVC